jgi:hypothetical protein
MVARLLPEGFDQYLDLLGGVGRNVHVCRNYYAALIIGVPFSCCWVIAMPFYRKLKENGL